MNLQRVLSPLSLIHIFVDGFNKALAEMKSNGDYDKILKKYGITATKKATPVSYTHLDVYKRQEVFF